MLPDRSGSFPGMERLCAFYGQSPAIPEGKSWVISGDHCAYCWKMNLFSAVEAQMRSQEVPFVGVNLWRRPGVGSPRRIYPALFYLPGL